jgi:putative molybdopterin biosynthesis protein
VHKIQLHYNLVSETKPAASLGNPFIALLSCVREQGSIAAAARQMGLSYRHVWGELKRWEADLGIELLHWGKGQSAQLTSFSEKLIWAERQTQARLAPQIDSLRADLERTFAQAFDPSFHLLTMYASHDDALPTLRDELSVQGLHLDLRFCGSVDAIRALNEERCVIAGFHCLEQPKRSSVAAQSYRKLLQRGKHKIIGFATREQGLIVRSGNPLALHHLQGVVTKKARFALRAQGSGTRVLLSELMKQEKLNPLALHSLAAEEPSHAAVAQAVASGAADVGLAIKSAAQDLGLDFVPLVHENYWLVCLKSAIDSEPITYLRQFLKTQEWQNRLAKINGYAPHESGQVQSLQRILPWWLPVK